MWARQRGKSTTLAAAALDEMMATPGRLVTYASASLLLGREIVTKESQVLQGAVREFMATAAAADLRIETVDGATHRATGDLTADDFTELFEAQRLEFRLWFDQTTFSRTQVIAPNPATARGWSGTVILDEFGFIRDFRDLWEAVEPIISSDREFRFLGATTPPKDDAHYSYELTSPPRDMEFTVNPEGNWYTSESGELVHRVDIYDSWGAGQKIYDRRTGEELTPGQHFARAEDKDGWRRNYAVQHILGGTSAVGTLTLETAQRRGVANCAFFQIECDLEMEQAVAWIRQNLGPGAVGLGIDPATTTKESSNPTAVAIAERIGVDTIFRAILIWKTSDPKIQRERFLRLLEGIAHRPVGGRARRGAIDATNERMFAADLRDILANVIPLEMVVGSEVVAIPGAEDMNQKQRLGSKLVAELEDNHVWLPPERYVKEDFRLVKKDRGQFICHPDEQGRHGDTFDAAKLALFALSPMFGALESTEGIRLSGSKVSAPSFRRRLWKR